MSPTFITSTASKPRRYQALVDRLHAVFQESPQLKGHASGIRVTIEGTAIILKGELQSEVMKQQLVPTIRRAGILWQVCNLVQVST